jgi:hypothetical protein
MGGVRSTYTVPFSSNFNYGHHQQHLSTVTMDETTHSVYLNGGNGFWTGTKYFWLGFSEKGDDGQCRGEQLGQLPSDGDCVNLDAHFSQRINCLRLSNNG